MEIGSEFWLEDKQRKENKKYNIDRSKNRILLLSGRTAIDYGLDIIGKKKEIKNVYFPSYCCNSMLSPFLSRNIKIDFYDVNFKDGKFVYDIDCNKKCDLFFAMNYFGFSCNNMDFYIDEFKKKNVFVMEDSTHSWLSERKYNPNSDLVIASLRKWFPIISGGILISSSENFTLHKDNKLEENYEYNHLKENAMKRKNKYINNIEKINKSDFLQEFSKANKILEQDYRNYKIDNVSEKLLEEFNIEEIINRRKENVSVIYENLEKQSQIEYVKDLDLEKDCPLFVPIFLKNQNERDTLRNQLIQKQIYCPNHWDIPDIIKEDGQKDIYVREISLICDQRYSKEEISNYLKYI